MHQKKLDKPSANFTFLRLEASLNGTLRVIFWRQRIEAKLVCGGSSVWSIAGGGTGDIHLSFCGSRARSWCGIISYQGKGATLLTKGQTNQNRSSRLFSKSVFFQTWKLYTYPLYLYLFFALPDMSWQFHTVAIFPSHGMDGTQIWIKFDNFVCQAESPMDRKQGGSGFQNILVGQTGWPTRKYSGEYSEETGVAQGGTQESMDHPQPVVLASANQGTSYSMQLSSLFRLMIITTITTISF